MASPDALSKYLVRLQSRAEFGFWYLFQDTNDSSINLLVLCFKNNPLILSCPTETCKPMSVFKR